ncbi:MAG TPA: lipid IV(A) 3-deoxy-D-manno-octulosonic acid transferase [Gammaproteobacteria bacterium]|nr:lipid IV(A) 3-deoxy-D-manno-octulosonic acid transferase [Gammaproteobacteria bacterium]
MRYLYSLLFYLSTPAIFLRLWWKGRKLPGYRQRWAERLGFIQSMAADGCIWLHAVSVGELIAARPLITSLQARYPQLTLVITNMTASGSGLAAQLAGERLRYYYVPYDMPDVVNRFLNRTRPRLAIIMETELWPNLLHYTSKRKIPILLANARLSGKSAQGYQHIAMLVKPMLQKISVIAAQTQEDAKRFKALGADPARTLVWGNMKFDVKTPLDLVEKGQALRASWGQRRPTLIAASTHAGEEEQILQAFTELRKTWPTSLLILVPRHPDRFDEVAVLCQKRGFSTIRRSQGQACTPETQIFLGDSLGELFLYYAAADVAFVGGSLVAVGGHNLLEPAALGLPIVTGPQLFNFTEIYHLLQQVNAVICVNNEKELATTWSALLEDEAKRIQMGEQARMVVETNRGAVEKHLDYIATQM